MLYNRNAVKTLVQFLRSHNGKLDKPALSKTTKEYFGLTLDRSVFTGEYFSIRFCHAAGKNPSNTVLSLSALQKYDDRPFIVCVVTPNENHLLLANTTFLAKISHSSQQLRIDNIKGSFNGSDILRSIDGVANTPENFETLFLMHETFGFSENLECLVEKTNAITPTGKRFEPTQAQLALIQEAPFRAAEFLSSPEFDDLAIDLYERVQKVRNEIAIAAFIDNVNIRGRIIEYLITSNGDSLRDQIIDCLQNKKPFPAFKTEDNLGDYIKNYERYSTATEIKTKVLFLAGNPKAYNIDKLLSFLSDSTSIYMIYIVGIDDAGGIGVRLCSAFDKQLLDGTVCLFHWAGRNSRGVTQFMGNALIDILKGKAGAIDICQAQAFLEKLLEL